MNKFFFLLVGLFLFSQTLSAQWSFGLKAGLNRANIESFGPEIADELAPDLNGYWNDARWGFHAGLAGSYAFSEKLALRTELLYSAKGFQSSADSPLSSSYKLRMSYLSVPILMDYQPVNKLHILAGPSFSYRVLLTSEPSISSSNLEDIWNNSFDFGLAAGIEYRIGERLQLGIRYVYALSDASKITYTDENAVPIGDGKFKNRTLQLSTLFWL